MVEIGDLAPNATVRKTDNSEANKMIELKDTYSKGRTILYFFPAAFTGVCTSSSCQLRDDIKEFEQLNAQLFGISADGPFTQMEFIKKNELNYPLLSDWNKEAMDAYGVRDDGFAGGLIGVSKRSLFLIDGGKIAFKWVAETPGNYPPFDELKSLLN